MFVALLWAPNYFHFRSSPDEVRRWTLPNVRALFPNADDKVLVFLADCVEFIAQGSLHIIEQLFLYSFKLKKAHSLKLLTVCLSLGLIIWRAPLFGGSTSETTPLERFLKSAEFERARASFTRGIFVFTDRGFSRLSPDLLKGVHLLHPGLEPLRAQYSALHAVWKQVRIYACLVCSSSSRSQWQQGVRAREEISNRFIRLHHAYTHSSFPYRTHYDLEWYVEILCGIANMHVICGPNKHLDLGALPGWAAQRERLLFFRDVYYPPSSPDALSLRPRAEAVPAIPHQQMWGLFQRYFPATDDEFARALCEHAQGQLRKVQSTVLGGAAIPYHAATWTHRFPDKRAKNLMKAHCILFIEFGLPIDDGPPSALIQGTVHPSERNYCLHYPTLRIPLNAKPPAFALSEHTCSCADGYVLCDCVRVWISHSVCFSAWQGSVHTFKRCSWPWCASNKAFSRRYDVLYYMPY